MQNESLSVYIPMDRRQALAHECPLPQHSTGTALFADISGFTRLTDSLTHLLGVERAAEELSRQLNAVYDVLITQVHDFRGSVIGFSGDAITCWFDSSERQSDHTALCAIACAVAMQAAMQDFASVLLPNGVRISMNLKTGLASGPVQRFQVGDAHEHLLDVLAGQTLQRMSQAEHVSHQGEIVVDEATATKVGNRASIVEWRTPASSRQRFGIITDFSQSIPREPWQVPPLLTAAQIRPWCIPAVYARHIIGLNHSSTELRPAVALFLRFSGIDYDNDVSCAEKLNAYVLWVQSIVAKYEGLLVDITFGDKGSYLYAAFGTPTAHDDDVRRAVSTALELCAPPPRFTYLDPVQIGVSSGIMRTGPCGGTNRRTYAVLGDEANVAARLMQNAAPGTILVSRQTQLLSGMTFTWDNLSPIRVKGKSQPVPVARPLCGISRRPTSRL